MKKNLMLIVLVAALAVGLVGYGMRSKTSADKGGPSLNNINATRNVFSQPDAKLTLSNSLETAQRNTETSRSLIQRRGGVEFSPEAISLLNQAEARFAVSGKSTLTASGLTKVLADLAVERLSQMNDQEIDSALNTMKGVRSDKYPNGMMPQDEIMLRPWGPVVKVDKARSYLLKAKSSSENSMFRDFAALAIGNEVDDRIKLFSAANPQVWSSDRITPTQAVILTYSVLSGDLFNQTQDQLNQNMQRFQRHLAEKRGVNIVIDGKFAYGTSGIIYASPLNLFDDKSMKSLLSKLN